MRAKLRAIKEALERRRHEPIPLQGKWLGQVVRGYFAYHAVPTNTTSMTIEVKFCGSPRVFRRLYTFSAV